MISIERSYDVGLIDSILRNPTIYASMCDDSCPKEPESVSVCAMIDALIFLLVKKSTELSGCFMFEPHGTHFVVHTCLLPACRGKDAIHAAILALDWVFERTECQEVSSYSFSDSPHVAWFARRVGLKPTGSENYPNPRNGLSVKITKYLITKEQFRN